MLTIHVTTQIVGTTKHFINEGVSRRLRVIGELAWDKSIPWGYFDDTGQGEDPPWWNRGSLTPLGGTST
jgi:hypothetical protein